jgi:hypothetical protein
VAICWPRRFTFLDASRYDRFSHVSRANLDEDALGDLLVEEMELIGADVLGAEAIGRGAEVLGELGHRAQIRVDGVGRVVANL